MIITITGFFVLLTIFKSFYFTAKNGGTDLRIRVVGSRLLTTDHSPYFYNWKPVDGEYYLNPNDVGNTVLNGNTVTPAMLYVIYPVSWQRYPTVRILWTIIQFILAFASIYLLFKNKNGLHQLIPVCVILTGLLCSDIWLLNIERGQIYIFYAFLFALMYSLYTSNWKHGYLLSGLIGGLFIFFRPFAVIIGLVFLLNVNKKWLLGYIIGFMTGVLLFVLPQPSLWADYFEAMNKYASQYTGHPHLISNAAEYTKPAIIEGATNLGEANGFNISGLNVLYSYFKNAGIIVSQNLLYVLYGLTVILFSFLFFRKKRTNATPQFLFLFTFLLYILSEFFVTVPRGNYNLIQWFFPLSLIVWQNRLNQAVLILLITGLLLLHNFPFVFPYQAAMAELIFIGITIYCIFFPSKTITVREELKMTL